MKCEEIENSSNTKTNLHLEADLEISVDSRGSFGDSAIMHQVNFDIEVPEVLGSRGPVLAILLVWFPWGRVLMSSGPRPVTEPEPGSDVSP